MAKRHPSLIPLSQDHHHGLALALRCRKHALGQLNPGDHEGLERCAREAYRFWESALIPHFEAEESVLFTRLSAHAQCRSLVAQLENEHREFRAKLSSDERLSEPKKFLFDFGDLLERHIRREERELFPMFEELIPSDEADRIGVEIKRMLKAARTADDVTH
jgi:hemerythrin-like domain-containing protein